MRLILENISHRYSDKWLFKDLSYTFTPGATYALTGPSGSGKSTLLSIASGWLSPTSGRVVRENLGKINWVFQNSYGMPRRTVLDHVAVALEYRGYSRRSAILEAEPILRRFGLVSVKENQFRSLSGGEAQRLMLARAVASQPSLLLVDEPTAQLDTQTARRINACLNELSEEGRIVIVATHDHETEKSCDAVVDLRRHVKPGGQ